jgi:ATP-binding cassette, subfamily B, bacterial PglK
MTRNLRRYFSDLLFLLGKEQKKLPGILASFLVVALLDMIGLAIIGVYIVVLTGSENISSKPLLAIMSVVGPHDGAMVKLLLGLSLLTIFLAKAVIAVLVQRHIFRFGAGQAVRMRAKLTSTVLQMPYEVFTSRNSSEYVQSLVSYVSLFSSSIIVLLRLFAEGTIILGIGSILIMVSGISVVLLIAIGLGSFFVYDRITRSRLREAGHTQNESGRLMIQGVQESVSGLKELRVLGYEGYFLRKIDQASRQAARASVFLSLMGTIPRYIMEVAVIFLIVGMFGIFVLQGVDLESMYPMIGMLGVAAIRLGPASGMILGAAVTIRASRPAITSLRQEFDKMDDGLDDISDNTLLETSHPFKSLELRNVVFRYRGASHPAINEVSLTITSGEIIGLTGTSGAGKTTVVDIILGLFDRQKGEILYNGNPLSEHLRDWRSSVAYLPQEIFLLDASLKENVALGIAREYIDENRINTALQQASLSDLVTELPQGIETLIGERGIRLSGGQRQRVALARALYHQRDVLIMDEATSALDYETEQEIVEQIRKLKGQKTIIVIAHRLATLRYCDRIYVLKNGCVTSINSYAEIAVQ